MLMCDFWYKEQDVNHLLPASWREQILMVANHHAVLKTLRPRSVTSRERDLDAELPVLTVGGRAVSSMLPWLVHLYRRTFRELAQQCVSEEVHTASDARYAVNINIQRGTGMRYECHVDSNPVEGLLYVTSHPQGSGGELVVARRKSATCTEEVDRDCITIEPRSGTLVFFDARKHAHYVRPLKDESAIRVVVAMNFYTPSCSEQDRPADLNRHLFGED